MSEKPITTAPYSTSVGDNYYIFVNEDGTLKQVDIDIISKFLVDLKWANIEQKPFVNIDSNQFKVVGDDLTIEGYHTHDNINILNKFDVDESGQLVYDSEPIAGEYILPVATKETLGGIKPDGTTITIDEDGTIHGANTYELPTATTEVLGGVKVDGDTIKINDGIISADVIGNWSAGISYPVGYFVVYGEGMWECMVAHTSESTFNESKWMPVAFRAIKIYNWSTNTDYYLYQLVVYNNMIYRAIEKHTSGGSFDESKWELISGGTTGTTINDWSAQTDYVIGDLVINETTLYKCNTEHTSGETFDETESANWTTLSGEKGDKGYSPIASVAQTDTGCTVTVTDANGTTTANLTNGANGKDGASPTIDPTTKNWIVGTVDTGVKAEAQSNYFYTGTEFPTSDLIDGDLYLSFAESTRGNVYQYQETTLDWSLQGNLYGGGAVIDDTSTVGNTVTWSASKINSILGDINTVLASVTGGIT